MIFPTLEEIENSPNGKILKYYFNPIPRLLISYFVILIKYFPHSFLRKFIKTFILHDNWDVESMENLVDHVLDIIDRDVWMNIASMAHSEMKEIKEFDFENVNNYSDKITFYYSDIDGWAPFNHYMRMKERFLGDSVFLCNHKHAFVLDARECKLVAETLWEWMDRKE